MLHAQPRDRAAFGTTLLLKKEEPMQDNTCCAPSCCNQPAATTAVAETQQIVKDKYGSLARQVSENSARASCCGSAAQELGADAICDNLYALDELSELPEAAVLASLGCGNPTALAKLEPGQVVLDLGSGGGIDVLLSARRVGPTGKAYGLDMTDDMLELARANQQRAGVTNVEFLKGEIEKIPLPANSVDVIISNCVVNLSADKDQVLREAFRVLKPGGLFAVSDIVSRGEVPAELRRNVELWIGCVAGALHQDEYTQKLQAAGFLEISIEPTRVYSAEDAEGLMQASGSDLDRALLADLDGKFFSGFIRARKLS
jgi:arsenite methyltransferase